MKNILFIVSEDWYFVSHRLHLAIVAIDNGYEVGLLSRLSTHQDLINSFGIKTYDWHRAAYVLFAPYVFCSFSDRRFAI